MRKYQNYFILPSMTDEATVNSVSGASADTEARPAPAKPRHPMEALLKTMSIALLKPGEIAEGVAIEKKGGMLFVDLGPRGTGIVYGREYKAAEDIIRGIGVGDRLSGKVVEMDNDRGYIELSLKEAGEERRWADIARMRQSGEPVEIKISEANRGGLILEYQGIRGFLPASQLSAKNYPRVEGGDKDMILGELQKLVGQTLRVKIMDSDPLEQKLIFSEKGIASEETLRALALHKIGDTIEGEVTGVVDFGAFVRFDEALEGLIHISEIDWVLIEDPRAVLKAGDRVSAKIIDIQGEKIALSLKALKEDPWVKIAEEFHPGDIVKGNITRFTAFGAFAQIAPQIQGLIHISEFGSQQKMQETLTQGRAYDFKIMLLDPKEHRMSLGIARDSAPTQQPPEEKGGESSPPAESSATTIAQGGVA